ncbi:MAG: PAS-domain containing protein [Rhodospirillales bacterium]|nr:PAS-domain containing protein [Rhodospirillales bacterium]
MPTQQVSPYWDWLDDRLTGVAGVAGAPDRAAQQAAILQIIFANTKIGVALYDPDYRLVTCNHNYQRLMNLPLALCKPGAPLEDVINYNARHGVYGPVDLESFIKERMSVVRTGQPIDLEVPVGDRFVLVTGIHLPQGGVVYTYQDVTKARIDERKLQALLAQSAALYAQTVQKNIEFQTLIDNLPIGVTLWDRDFRIVTFNPAAERMFEFPPSFKDTHPTIEDVLGALVARGEYGGLDAREGVLTRLRALRQGKTDSHLKNFRRTNHQGVTYEITETPLPDGGFVTTHIDISANIENERLLKLVADRQDATNQFSRQAIVDQINAGIAHEINQPLSVIGIHAYLLQEQLAQPTFDRAKVAESLAAIAASTRRAQDVQQKIKSLLGAKPPTPTSADLNVVIDKALDFVSPHMKIGRIAVNKRYAWALPPLLIDEVAFQQVIVNLMLNARDAIGEAQSPRRAIEVATAFDPAAGRVRVTIADSGAGIAPESLAAIFEPFFTTKLKGYGMGLAICKTIVESLGGRISVASPPGQGATFTIELDCVSTLWEGAHARA